MIALNCRRRAALLALLCAHSAAAGVVTLSVNTRSGAAAGDAVIVFYPLDATPPPGHGTAIIDQINKRFVPRVSVVRTGTTVTFPNSDHIRHQVYSFSPAKPFTLKLYAGSPETPVVFDHPGLVVLGCNIHDDMVAFVGVVDSPYCAKTADSGMASLSLLRLPRSGRDARHRHARFGPREQRAAHRRSHGRAHVIERRGHGGLRFARRYRRPPGERRRHGHHGRQRLHLSARHRAGAQPVARAWIAMGFELDLKAARELADITGLAVTLSVHTDGRWSDVVSTVPPGLVGRSDVVSRTIEMSRWGNTEAVAVLSRSLADARAPFERLTKVLFVIAAVSLIASGFAAFWLARNITRPLQDLSQAVDRTRAGAYDATLQVHRRDELGVLAEGLQLRS